jgi:hypothetical protein
LKLRIALKTIVALVVLTFILSHSAMAQIITNGGFELGLTGWTKADQIGSDGSFFVQSGTTTPVTGATVPAPPGGAQAAMTDAEGPGSHVLYQDFLVPVSVPSASISFSLFVKNGADAYVSPASLNFATPALNQQVRVDILRVTSDPFTVAGADIVQNLFQTLPGDALTFGYTAFQRDITTVLQANAGQTLRLRFAEVDNVFNLNLGVDQVNIVVNASPAAPEPSSLLLVCVCISAMIGTGYTRRRWLQA